MKPKGEDSLDTGEIAKKSEKAANKIEEAMINSTNSWSSHLTHAIMEGQNMFEGLAKTVQQSFLQSLVVDPLVKGIQGGISKNFSTANSATPQTGSMSMSIINNFNPNVTATVRSEIQNAAPLITQSAIAGMQQRQYNGLV